MSARPVTKHFLWRMGHLWVENPLSLIGFAWRSSMAIPAALEELGSKRRLTVMRRYTRQVSKTFVRGLLVVALLGVLGGAGVGSLTAITGPLLNPLIYETLMTVVLANLAPLLLAVAISARTGSAVAGKLASFPAVKGEKSYRFERLAFSEHVLPHLVAGVLTAAMFYLVVAWCLVAGYYSQGTISMALSTPPDELFRFLEVGAPARAGLVKATIFGGVVVFAAAAFGVQAAERFVSETDETHDVHYAAWESMVTSVIVCSVLTGVFWTPALGGTP